VAVTKDRHDESSEDSSDEYGEIVELEGKGRIQDDPLFSTQATQR
jgi:hypothetical protein